MLSLKHWIKADLPFLEEIEMITGFTDIVNYLTCQKSVLNQLTPQLSDLCLFKNREPFDFVWCYGRKMRLTHSILNIFENALNIAHVYA